MEKDRLLAFSDGVIAIIITIMVLELKAPKTADLAALVSLLPIFLSYALSFVYVAIYWNNHHHLLYTADRVDGAVLWANMHLLFWLSLIPFATAWLDEAHFAALPTAIYGVALLMPAIAYKVLQTMIVRVHGNQSVLAKAVGSDAKGWLSLVLYIASIPLAFVKPWISQAIFVVVAMIWLVPDKRIEEYDRVVVEEVTERAGDRPDLRLRSDEDVPHQTSIKTTL